MHIGLRWAARGGSLVSLGLLALFVGSGGPTWRDLGTGWTWLGLLFFPIGVAAGLLVAWRRERGGALIAVLSVAAFYAWHWATRGTLPRGAAFLLFASPAVLFWLAAVWPTRA
jgi:hypothetical protein